MVVVVVVVVILVVCCTFDGWRRWRDGVEGGVLSARDAGDCGGRGDGGGNIDGDAAAIVERDNASACRAAGRRTRDKRNGHTLIENCGAEPISCSGRGARSGGGGERAEQRVRLHRRGQSKACRSGQQ